MGNKATVACSRGGRGDSTHPKVVCDGLTYPSVACLGAISCTSTRCRVRVKSWDARLVATLNVLFWAEQRRKECTGSWTRFQSSAGEIYKGDEETSVH